MEYWDLYLENGSKTNKTIKRDSMLSIPQGLYHYAVEIWVNVKGKLLLTQRHPQKKNGLLWECTSGAVLKDEEPLEAAQRELFEETAIVAHASELKLLGKSVYSDYVMFSYLCKKEQFPLICMQATEVVDYAYVDILNIPKVSSYMTKASFDHYCKYKEIIIADSLF